jgi:predicted small lipoprotein YifL
MKRAILFLALIALDACGVEGPPMPPVSDREQVVAADSVDSVDSALPPRAGVTS